MGDFFKDWVLATWESLQLLAHQRGGTVLFHYYRAQQTWRALIGDDLIEPQNMEVRSTLIKTEEPAKLITIFHFSLQDTRKSEVLRVRLEWQCDLGAPISDKEWSYCCTRTISLNGSDRLIHLTFLHRAYWTLECQLQYMLAETSNCHRCGPEEAGFWHLAWQCPGIYA